ncbi:MAG TPA: hypothetical protein VJQ25_02960, partial [Nitrospira sp.]|nr:hypothetical protein [Nitrospira sp.]
MKAPDLSVEGWAKVVGATSATLLLIATIWRPIKSWIKDHFDIALKSALRRNKDDIRYILTEDILAAEFRLLGETHEMSSANNDRLEMVDSALKAQGVALEQLPRIAGQMEGLPRALESLSKALLEMSENVGFIRGKVEERERWDGQERRHEDKEVDHN